MNMKNLWIKTFPHFAKFRPKRRVLLNLQYFFRRIPPTKNSESTYYTLFIRSNRAKFFSLVFNVLKDLGDYKKLPYPDNFFDAIISTKALNNNVMKGYKGNGKSL